MLGIQATGKLESVAIDDWTPQTLPTWRHSNWVGVWDPWPVIFKFNPFVWYKVLSLELPEGGTAGAQTGFIKTWHVMCAGQQCRCACSAWYCHRKLSASRQIPRNICESA